VSTEGDGNPGSGHQQGRPRHAGQPIVDDDTTIAAALEDLSVPALMMSMVHMTGDPSILEGDLRPAGIFINEVQGFMSPEDQSAVRAWAREVIRDYRDNGSVLPPPPDPDTVREMMRFIVAGEVPDEYVPLLLEELELDGRDARNDGWADRIPAEAKADAHVVVIGAGMSGLLAAVRLEEAGIGYTVIEKNAGVGGTWYENRYPGCRVDVGNHFYCYSFEPDDQWTEFFAQSPELQAYFDRCARNRGVMQHIHFETEVTAARWDERAGRWQVTTRGADGSETTIEATAVISAVGQLNRPRLPELAGIDTFAGRWCHSARWPDDLDVTGARVAVVGTGASAFQIVPTIAPRAAHVDVYQRSAQWMFPNPNYHEQVGDGVRWALRHLPYYGRWYRFLLFWPACDGGMEAMVVDPDWPHPERAVSAANDAAREVFTQFMADQVGDDPELLAKVVPDYVCLGKRTLQDNGSWLGALTRDDVDLIDDPIAEVRPEGVVTEDSTLRPADVIIYATGFHANRYLWPMEIIGRDGRVLSEQWGEDPTAHLGITVPGFPNLFCLYGPGTNLAHGGSIIFNSECQVRYVMGCLTALLTGGHDAMEVRQEVHDHYNARLQEQLGRMVWTHPSIAHSWYRNDAGTIRILSPWRMVDYWAWTHEPDLDEFTLTP
jgi:4-hydroxyacetophenone monooxygenase